MSDDLRHRAPPAARQPLHAHVKSRWLQLRDRAGLSLHQRAPILAELAELAAQHNLIDRAAALAMYAMLAAVPSLLATFSVVGFLLGAFDKATDVTGLDLEMKLTTLARLTRWMHEALPGVTWNPADFAATLVRHRTTHGVVGFVLAVFLGVAVFGRIDAAIRDLFGRRRRSAVRAAGYMTALVVVMVLVAMAATLLGPLVEWGLHVTTRSVRTLSLGWIDAMGLIVALSQTLPVAVLFFLLVRWSAGGHVGRRRLALTAVSFGILWTVGQRLFTLYIKSVVKMDAVYGALTGVVALLLWLFYASIAFLLTVALVATLERRARRTHAERIPQGKQTPQAEQTPQAQAAIEAPARSDESAVTSASRG